MDAKCSTKVIEQKDPDMNFHTALAQGGRSKVQSMIVSVIKRIPQLRDRTVHWFTDEDTKIEMLRFVREPRSHFKLEFFIDVSTKQVCFQVVKDEWIHPQGEFAHIDQTCILCTKRIDTVTGLFNAIACYYRMERTIRKLEERINAIRGKWISTEF